MSKVENDVFISYSSKDKHIADAICSTLENNGIRCWIAPRDVLPGSDWAKSLINAIKSSKLMVLVFSQNSNGSSQVTKELNLAVANNVMVVPFKIDDVVPSGSMEYFLADTHWLDAIDGDMQEQIDRLKDVISSVLPHNLKEEKKSLEDEKKVCSKDDIASEDKVYATKDNLSALPFEMLHKDEENKKDKGRINLFTAYVLMWKKTFDYKGCTTRKEYWYAILMSLIVWIAVLFVDIILGATAIPFLLYSLAICVSWLSIGVRRLHDANKSGHWMWLFITVYGGIVPVIFFLLKGVDKNNRFKR